MVQIVPTTLAGVPPREVKSNSASEAAINLWHVLLIAFIAAIVVAIDLAYSLTSGLLSMPPVNDGIAYLLEAKSAFYTLQSHCLGHGLHSLYAPGYSPLWRSLMALNFQLFGPGEWQAYAARFWPTFLFLLASFFIVKRRSSPNCAWVAVIIGALLPTFSVGIHATIAGAVPPTGNYLGWYLSDLRSDLLFAACLMWSVILLCENHQVTVKAAALAGCSAGLAIVAKPSASVLCVMSYGICWMLVLLRHRHCWKTLLLPLLINVSVLFITILPWVLSGGINATIQYLYNGLVIQKQFYSNPNPSIWSEFTYYWNLYPVHMGLESVALLLTGTTCLIYSVIRSRKIDFPAMCYLIIAFCLYVVASITSNKNWFIGLSYYFFLWLCCWSLIAGGLLAKYGGKHLNVVAMVYACAMLAISTYANDRPIKPVLVSRECDLHNRETTKLMAAEMKALLTNKEWFVDIPIYGFPNALQFYMVGLDGTFPTAGFIGCDPRVPPEKMLDGSGPPKVVLLFEGDLEEVVSRCAQGISCLPVRYPYYRWLNAYVRNPINDFKRIKTFTLQFPSSKNSGGTTNIQVGLFAREPQQKTI